VVSAPLTDQLERIDLDAGAHVAAGTIVARIEPPSSPLLDDRTRGEMAARLAAARARERQATTAIASATIARDAASKDARRAAKLEEGGASSTMDRERAELREKLAVQDLAAAELAHRAALAEIDALRSTLEPRSRQGTAIPVVAPISGDVLRIVRESAGPVVAGTPLLELGDRGQLEVVIDVLSRDAERIVPGMNVELSTSASEPLRGNVTRIEPSAFTRVSALGVEEQRVNIVVSLDAPVSTLGDNYRVDARIILWRGTNVLHVPASALFRSGNRWAVYTVHGGRARMQLVELGHRGRLDVEVISGIPADATVIVHPSDRVADGVKVAPRT
jgi:HlyD family secretion protein